MKNTFVWTEKGRAFANLWSSQQAIEEMIEREFEEYGITPQNMVLHTVSVGDVAKDRSFIVRPREDGALMIDVAVFEEMGKLDSGPFKGKTHPDALWGQRRLMTTYSRSALPPNDWVEYADAATGEGRGRGK